MANTRRRGEELVQAIYRAVFAELSRVGFGRLSMEGVAACAGTGKAPLYRRWPSISDLVIDAVHNGLPDGDEPPDTGSVRDDLHLLLTQLATALAGPAGGPMRALVGEMHRDPRLAEALRSRVFEPRAAKLREVLARGAQRGEIRAELIDTDLANLGHELVMFRFLTDGPVPPPVIDEILDSVVLPLLGR